MMMTIKSNIQKGTITHISIPYTTDTGTVTTPYLYKYHECDICRNQGWYRDYAGVWHRCPKCTTSPYNKWIVTC